jgi:hypothetical protein
VGSWGGKDDGSACWASYCVMAPSRGPTCPAPYPTHDNHMPIITMTPASQSHPTMQHSTCHASEGTYTIPRHRQWVPMHLPLLTTVSRKQDIYNTPDASIRATQVTSGVREDQSYDVGPRLVQWHRPEAPHVLPPPPPTTTTCTSNTMMPASNAHPTKGVTAHAMPARVHRPFHVTGSGSPCISYCPPLYEEA